MKELKGTKTEKNLLDAKRHRYAINTNRTALYL